MFSKLPKKRPYAYGKRTMGQSSSFFGKLYADAMEKSITTRTGRAPAFRPSSLPMCSIHVYLKLMKGASLGYFEQEMSAAGGYFTSVGTAAHENIQYYIGTTGKVWGDWNCITPYCQKFYDTRDLYNEKGAITRKGSITAKNTTNNICPCCKHPMGYVEKEIKYKGLVGHIDCIILLPNGHFWVADYKTTTARKIMSKKLPHSAHLIQLPAYCYVLAKKYGMVIDGFSLLYLSRDNPFNFYEYSEKWTPVWSKRSGDTIKHERKKFVAGVRSFALKDRTYAIAAKPCSSRKQYETDINFYDECELLSVCFNKRRLNDYLDKAESAHRYSAKSIQQLIPVLNLQEGDL